MNASINVEQIIICHDRYIFFFNTFPVNMVLQYAKYGNRSGERLMNFIHLKCNFFRTFFCCRALGKWADYRYGEMGYIVLSLLSKSLLAWLVFGGTNQPDGDDDA